MKEKSNLSLAVVMPVYNEEKIIEQVLTKWVSVLDNLVVNYFLHVYNDGSIDNTQAVLNKFSKECIRVIVHNQKNQGHGATILKGYKDNVSAEWIFQTDSDNEIEADAFMELWKRRQDHDFLIGRRIQYANSLSRRIISAVSRFSVRLLFGRGLYDTNSPFRLMRTNCFKRFFDVIPDDTFAPNVIISGIAVWKKMRILELGVAYHFRKTGNVSIKHFRLFWVATKSFVETLKFFLLFRVYFKL